jgi:formamidopyrimidine-DNA glycosylase
MPELPEVENVRRTLCGGLLGRPIYRVRVLRSDVVHGQTGPAGLLCGQKISSIERRGKQLALVGENGRCVCIHLGMTGALVLAAARQSRPEHTHVIWSLPGRQLRFQDPRRFGGIWTFSHHSQLSEQRWRNLGHDALSIRSCELMKRLARTRRCIKAALLDQGIIAGLGNIYVDELLFSCRLNPFCPASTLQGKQIQRLVRHMRQLLRRAIAAGGSTLRDYVDAHGHRGSYQSQHRVYGRATKPCVRCHQCLSVATVGGRRTVWCSHCQIP